jgi:Kdo2-lipid IVA lauroyltransferase/acyltransferase
MERKILIASLAGFFLKIIAALIYILPRRLKLFFGDLLAVFAFDVVRFRRKIVMDNLAIAFPEKSISERAKIGRGSYRNLGRGIFEYAYLSFLNKKWINKNYDMQGLRNFAEVNAGDKGVLFLGLHMGNGDLGMAAMAMSGFDLQVISKHFKSEWLNKLWFGLRESKGIKFIPEEKSSFQILKALKKKASVAFVLDQFMGPPIGVATKFFGKETGTAMGLALFSIKTGLPVVPAYNFRKPDGKFVIIFDPPIPPLPTENLDQDIARLTQTYTDWIEKTVRKHPDQWMWLHRRWKTFEVR